MKKSIQAVVAAVVVVFAVVNVYKAQPKVELSDFQVKNVEALATGEWLEGTTPCFKEVTWAPNDGSLAVWVTKCEIRCMDGWAIEASKPWTCSPL